MDSTNIFEDIIDPTNSASLSLVLFILNILSLLLNFLLIIKLNSTSKLVQILIITVYAEGYQHFCQAIVFGNQLWNKYTNNFINDISEYNVLLLIPFWNLKNKHDKMYRINALMIFATESFSFLMHIFLHFELILMLKNPIGSDTMRKKIYITISCLGCIIVFFLPIIFNEATISSEDTFLFIIKTLKSSVIANFALFSFSVFLGLMNIFFTIKRLGFKTFFKQTLYNKFLFGQIIMTLTYYSCLTCFKFISLSCAIGLNIQFSNTFIIVSIMLYSSLGLVQFFTRVLETNFYNMIGRLIKRIFCCKKDDLNESSLNDSKDNVSLFYIN